MPRKTKNAAPAVVDVYVSNFIYGKGRQIGKVNRARLACCLDDYICTGTSWRLYSPAGRLVASFDGAIPQDELPEFDYPVVTAAGERYRDAEDMLKGQHCYILHHVAPKLLD